jgi:hypothetical protein
VLHTLTLNPTLPHTPLFHCTLPYFPSLDYFSKLDVEKHTQAGLPRTASTSLKKALDILGVDPSFHLGDPPAPIARIRESARALQIKDRSARQVALWKLYHGFQATFEMPGSVCVDDMLEIWPDAKVRHMSETIHGRIMNRLNRLGNPHRTPQSPSLALVLHRPRHVRSITPIPHPGILDPRRRSLQRPDPRVGKGLWGTVWITA